MLDQSRHSGVQRSRLLHVGFCARCTSVLGPYWFASLLGEVMHAVGCVLRYSLRSLLLVSSPHEALLSECVSCPPPVTSATSASSFCSTSWAMGVISAC